VLLQFQLFQQFSGSLRVVDNLTFTVLPAAKIVNITVTDRNKVYDVK